MSDYLNDLKEFWDDFAQEYEEIQQESPFPIAADLQTFLLEERLLPCQSFLDLAGGTGRYLATLQKQVKTYTLVDLSQEMLKIAAGKADNHVQLVQQAQETFLNQNQQRYQLVFSAMNPALQTQRDLLKLCQASSDWCLILRVIKDEDTLFSPYEDKNPELVLNARYKTFLAQMQLPYHSHCFSYTQTETVSRAFFQAYFTDNFSPTELATLTQKTFGTAQEKSNQQWLDFELIYFQVPKAYNRKEF